MNFIKGNQNPVIGVTTYFEVVDLGLGSTFTSPYNLQYVWYIYKKGKNGIWENVTENDGKTGTKVPYKFGDIAIGVPFKLEVRKAVRNLFTQKFESSKFATLELLPTSNKNYSIQKVVLFNNGAKDPNKATYKDSLIARAYCVSMFNKDVEFQLWEDDAAGEGHNAEINKNNKLPQIFKARVNSKGIAEAKISLLSNEKVLKGIANKYMMSGDKNEGANHEYYVTATYGGKIQGASQVNVNVANTGVQPKKDSAIFSGNSNQPPKSDKEGKVTHAYFIDSKGNPTQKIKVGDSVKIRIKTVNMIGEYIQYIVWEKDGFNSDDIFRSPKLKITAGTNDTSAITITQDKYNEGIDGDFTLSGDPDKDQQQYYIEIIPLNTKAKSVSFGIDDESKRTKVDNAKSASVVNNPSAPKTLSTCICKEEYKDLIWGGKVSCDFRKKVMEICEQLWPGKSKEMADGLMAVINVETGGTFKAHQIMGRSLKDVNILTKDDFWQIKKDKNGKIVKKTSRAVGLIQFTQTALEEIGQFKSGTGFDKLHEVKLRFARMGEVDQLFYVQKYFENSKTKIRTPEDIYLQVFAPKGVGKDDTYILYEGGTEEYTQNASVDTKSIGRYKNDGDIQRSEILERFDSSVKEGKKNKTAKFSCSTTAPIPKPAKPIATKDGMLSKYLSLAQAMKSDTANKHKIDNTPSASEKENLKHLGVNIYDKIHEKFKGNLRLTSVFRNETLNKKVGGSSTSQHRYGQALDVQGINGITNLQIFKYVKENLDYHQIIWEFGTTSEPSWVHIGYKPSGNKKINTRALKVSGKTNYKTFDLSI